jgi:sporulation protein YlmC with PRC-barrel domain
MLHKLSELQGIPVQATDGVAGIVKDVYFDPDSWTVKYIAADTGAAPHGRLVLISTANVLGVYLYGLVGNGVVVNLKKNQIRKSPHVDTHPLISQLRKFLVLYNARRLVQKVTPAEKPSLSQTLAGQMPEESKLLNAEAISCYEIDAEDGEIGHVKDLLIDDNTWLIHFILVNPQKWRPGKSVLVGVDHVHDIDEENAKVHLNIVRDGVINAMAYDPNIPTYLSS